MTSGGNDHWSRKRVADRLTLVCCLATLLMGAAYTVFDFPVKYLMIPVVAAIVCAVVANPVTGIIEILWGGRS